MFIKELEARVTWALASLVTPMHNQCTPLAFSNSLALVFYNQRSKLPRNLLLFQTQVLQSSTNQNKPGKNASQTVSFHSFAYGITGTAKKLSASTWFSYIGKTNPFARALPVPFNCQQRLLSFQRLDTLALVHSSSYSNQHVAHHRLVHTYKTILYWALAHQSTLFCTLVPQTSLCWGYTAQARLCFRNKWSKFSSSMHKTLG